MDGEEIKKRVRAMLDESGIEYEWLDHARLFTMEDCHAVAGKLNGYVFKNLLLSNRQKSLFYMFLTDEAPFKSSAFSKALGVSRVSFVNGDDMMKLLGIVPGSVSPLALINDTQNRVRLVINRSILSHARLCMHPGDSTATVSMTADDMLKICTRQLGHMYDIIEMLGEANE